MEKKEKKKNGLKKKRKVFFNNQKVYIPFCLFLYWAERKREREGVASEEKRKEKRSIFVN